MTPDRFYNDMMSLATQSPRDAADVANTWRNRFLNMAQPGGVMKGAQVGTGAATGFVMGVMGGRWQAEDDDIWQDWKNGGYALANLARWEDGSPYKEGHAADPNRYPASKPGTIFGVPYSLLGTIVLAGGSMLLGSMGKMKSAALTGSAAYAGTVYWTAQLGDKVGYDWKMSQIEKAGNEAAQGGGAAQAA